ncbi:MAG: nucleotidyltransferase family protein [Bacteroidota bacterium]
MKAIIFAAGLGTRLSPLTDKKPKALIEINGIPLLEIVIERLKFSGIRDMIINVHHFAGMIIDFLNKKENFWINISVSDESDLLLDTGGGLKKASWFFDDNKPFLAHNVDILSNIDLNRLYEAHCRSDALATLVVRKRKTSRYFLFDKKMTLCGWKNTTTNEVKYIKSSGSDLTPLAFSGIQIIDPSIFDLLDEGVFSITGTYLDLAKDHKIQAFADDSTLWMDLGKKQDLDEAGRVIDEIKS